MNELASSWLLGSLPTNSQVGYLPLLTTINCWISRQLRCFACSVRLGSARLKPPATTSTDLMALMPHRGTALGTSNPWEGGNSPRC